MAILRAVASATMHEGKQPIANLITTAAVRDDSWEDWLELGGDGMEDGLRENGSPSE